VEQQTNSQTSFPAKTLVTSVDHRYHNNRFPGGRVLLLLTSTDTKMYYYPMFTALLTHGTKQ